MYKTIIISTFTAASLLLSGCGKDTTPSGSILNKVEENKIVGEKNIANVIGTFYKEGMKNISSDNCPTLTTNSDDAVEISIVETSKKYCGNVEGFKKEIQNTIFAINKEKGMAITFGMVNGREEFEKDGSFSKDEIDMYVKYNIPLEDAKQIKRIERDKDTIENVYFKHGIKSPALIKKWHDQYIKDSYMIAYLEAGVPKEKPVYVIIFVQNGVSAKEIKKWREIGYSAEDMMYLGKDIGLPLRDKEFFEIVKKNKLTKEQLIKMDKAGIKTIQEIKNFLKIGMGVEEVKKWTDAGVVFLPTIEEYKKANIKLEELKKYYKLGKYKYVRAYFIKKMSKAGYNKEEILKIAKISGENAEEGIKYKKYAKELGMTEEEFLKMLEGKRVRIDDNIIKVLKESNINKEDIQYYLIKGISSRHLKIILKKFKTHKEFQNMLKENGIEWSVNVGNIMEFSEAKPEEYGKELAILVKLYNKESNNYSNIKKYTKMGIKAKDIKGLIEAGDTFRLFRKIAKKNPDIKQGLEEKIKEAISKGHYTVQDIDKYIKTHKK